jgi:sulfur relay (sulfurtransferase) DsrF/TusC family protein
MVLIREGPRKIFKVMEALRLSVAMLGMGEEPFVVFVDDGVKCLRKGAFDGPRISEFLQAFSDLASLQALSDSMDKYGVGENELNQDLDIELVNLDELTDLVSQCKVVTTF